MNRDEQAQRLARLLSELDAESPPGEALDPNDLARLAAGRPSESVRAAIEARLDGEDAETVAVIAAAAPERGGERASISWAPWVAAAAVLLAVVGGWLASRLGETARFADADLVAAFTTLRQADPTTFGDVDPLLAAERDQAAPTLQRGGLVGVGPRGTVLTPRPTLRWQAVTGADSYGVEILSDEGESVLTTTSATSGLPWPADVAPLRPGIEYAVRVVSKVAGVRLEGGSAFRVADDAERARYLRAVAAIEERVSPDLRAVVRAQTALRLGLLDEAARQLADPAPTAAAALAGSTRSYLAARRGMR